MDMIYGEEQTKEVAQKLLIYIESHTPNSGATIVGLSGDLGAGKTTLVQAIAKEMGVVEKVVSPTFMIAKFYETKAERWATLIHIDAYRIEDIKELEPLGWKTMSADPKNLIIVEWSERIKEVLPISTITMKIDHRDLMRHITTII